MPAPDPLVAFTAHLLNRGLKRSTAGLYADWVAVFLKRRLPHTPEGARRWLRTLNSEVSAEMARTALTHYLRFETDNPDLFISMERGR